MTKQYQRRVMRTNEKNLNNSAGNQYANYLPDKELHKIVRSKLAEANSLCDLMRSKPLDKIAQALEIVLKRSGYGEFLPDMVIQKVPDKLRQSKRLNWELGVDSVQDDSIFCYLHFFDQDAWQHDTRYIHIPSEWLTSIESLYKASNAYWKQKQADENCRVADTTKTDQEYELYLKLKRKYEGEKNV